MVGELGVVGDVLQVVEHLLARGGDDDRDGHGSTARASLLARPRVGRTHAERARRLGGAGGEAHGVAVLAVADDLARDRRLAPAQRRQSSQTTTAAGGPRTAWTRSPVSGVRPQSAQRARSASSAPRPRLSRSMLELLDVSLRASRWFADPPLLRAPALALRRRGDVADHVAARRRTAILRTAELTALL